jgi:hypothetical protein
MCKQDKTKYCQEYAIQSLTKIGAHSKSLAIAAVWKMKEIHITPFKPYIRLIT